MNRFANPRSILALSSAALLVGALGCQTCKTCWTTSEAQGAASPTADEAQSMATLAALEGEWEMEGPEGATRPSSTFTVSSAGSVVREVMFPGTPNEMTNLYHMDGGQVVCTHYCAAGNQPRMVAPGGAGNSFTFTTDSVSNLLESHTVYMGGLTLTIVDENTLEQHWTSYAPDGEVAGEMVFVMRRVN